MAKNFFYAVANGRNVGVYSTWAQCRKEVEGYPSARYKKFCTESEAVAFIDKYRLGGKSSATVIDSQTSSLARISTKQECRKRKSVSSCDLPLTPKRLKDCNDEIWKDAVVVYTDGACSNNGQECAKAGYGIYWGPNHKNNTCGPVIGAPTNNRGELLAVDIALKQAIENKINRIVIRTDSQLLIKSIDSYMDKWKKNSWKTTNGEDVKNQDILHSIDESTRRIYVKFEYVPGHSGESGNEAADELARRGACMYGHK